MLLLSAYFLLFVLSPICVVLGQLILGRTCPPFFPVPGVHAIRLRGVWAGTLAAWAPVALGYYVFSHLMPRCSYGALPFLTSVASIPVIIPAFKQGMRLEGARLREMPWDLERFELKARVYHLKGVIIGLWFGLMMGLVWFGWYLARR